MPRLSKPYVKCEKRDGEFIITVMKGGFQGHVLANRSKVPIGDMAALQTRVEQMINEARGLTQ